jgi:hypothetical protein
MLQCRYSIELDHASSRMNALQSDILGHLFCEPRRAYRFLRSWEFENGDVSGFRSGVALSL